MMKKIILLLTLFLVLESFAQKSSDSAIELTLSNYMKEADDFFLFKQSCIGAIKLIKVSEIDCDFSDATLYVFWKKDDDSYFKKIDNCKTTKHRISNNIFDFFRKNSVDISNENVEPYKIDNGFVGIDHSCFPEFYFYNDSVLINKSFNQFDLTTDEDNPNLRYISNNTLKIVLLYKMCDEVIRNTKS